MTGQLIRILVAAEPVMIRRGLAYMLASLPGVEIAGEARLGKEVVELCRKSRVDIVLLDLFIENEGCSETVASLHGQFPAIKVLVMANSDEYRLIQQAVAAGSAGILWKNADDHELAAAIRQVLGPWPYPGERAPGPPIPLTPYRAVPELLGSDLTERERQVLALISQGMTNPQIGREMHTSHATIKTQVSSILSKLGVSSRTEAAALAIQLRLAGVNSAPEHPPEPLAGMQPPAWEASSITGRSMEDPLAALSPVDPEGRALVSVADRRFVYANPAYRQFTGLPELDPVGQRYDAIWSAGEGPTSWKAIQQVLDTGEAAQYHPIEQRLTLHTFSYHIVPLSWQGQPAVGLFTWDTTGIAWAGAQGRPRALPARTSWLFPGQKR